MRSRTHRRQQGYIMIWVALMVTLIMVALVAELPYVKTAIKRDREQELIHRGAQYARAVKKYYKRFGAYPMRVEQLEDTNKMRFLRRRYKDPFTGEDFRALHFGDVKLQTKPVGAATGPGVLTGGVTGQNPGTGGGPFGQPLNQGGPFGPDGQPIPQTQQMQQGTGMGFFPSSGGQPGDQQQTQQPPGQQPPGQQPGTFSTLGQMGATGPSFGGGPIVGFASKSTKESLHIFNEKNHYNDWEFIYDPTMNPDGILITGPYNGPPKVGAGGIQGLNPAGQPVGVQPTRQQGPTQSPPSSNPFGQRPLFR